jgi:hypothetical protein
MSTNPTPAPEPASFKTMEEGISKLTKDLKFAATKMTPAEARFLVDSYYNLQDSRIRTGGQMRQMKELGEPSLVLSWMNSHADKIEDEIAKALDSYSNSFVLGHWARSQYGVGPVLAAGLLAHIDLRPWHCTERNHECSAAKPCTPQCAYIIISTCGSLWRFAGQDPTNLWYGSKPWTKGELRPWNADLKVLCWKLGESFVKTCNREGDFYGHLLVERKDKEIAKNAAGDFAKQAAAIMVRTPKHRQGKMYYAQGKLSPGHIHARSKRYAVKLFLAHYHQVAYELKFGTKPPKPYILTVAGGHTHEINVPNWPMQEVLPKTLRLLP